MLISQIWLILTGLALLIWLGLLLLWGNFWRSDQRLDATPTADLPTPWPSVQAIIPARNEAPVIGTLIQSLAQQTYPGPLSILLVDDQSDDGTAAIAQAAMAQSQSDRSLTILTTPPLPKSWSGKLWALHQGVQNCLSDSQPDYFLLTDADIYHAPDNLRSLVVKAEQEQLNLASLMVKLRCESFWERLLIPAFVFFFQMLYPFPWVNDPNRKQAGAAGGCILVRREALNQAGGIEVVREALIDDCSLAAAIKAIPSKAQPPSRWGRIWLGLATDTLSLRAYDTLDSIWNMVARTAFTQLSYSPLYLMGAVLGMVLVYLVAPLGLVVGLGLGQVPLIIAATLGWGMMAIAYYPTVRLYKLSPLWALSLPIIAFLYTLMTIDSALRHWRGQGGAWKGRVYP
jgi:hopene-associated glycosyltransferase HpnB